MSRYSGTLARSTGPVPSARTPEDIVKVQRALKERGTPFHMVKPGALKFPFSCIPTDIRMKKLALRLALADLGAGDDAEPHLQALEDVIADAEDRAPDEA